MKRLNQIYSNIVLNRENKIIAEAEKLLYRRLVKKDVLLNSPEDVKRYLKIILSERDREIFGCIFLDAQHQMIEYRELFLGTLDHCSVHPREVLKMAIQLNASAVILTHNHPSGNVSPSEADKWITNEVKKALALINIHVLDHFIVGEEVLSFSERRLL